MKYLFVFLLLGMTFVINSQKRHHFDEVAYADFDDLSNTYIQDKTPDSSSIVILKSTKLPLTGTVYTKWENNQLNFEYNYKEGLADGLCRQWYVNGQLSIELNYKAREIISQKCWDKEGNSIKCLLVGFSSVINAQVATAKQPNCDEVEGIEVHESDIEKEPKDYTELPNNYTGNTKICFDGKVIQLTPFINGDPNGIGRAWHKNGQLKGEGYYKDGLSEGLMRGWHENGQLRYDWNWKDGKIDGLWRSWYENGQLYAEINYKNGEVLSFKCWDEEGNEIDCK